MKRFFVWSALLSILFVACTADEEQFNNPIVEGEELYAGFDTFSRTYVEDNTYLRWHADDRLTAFYGNTLNRQYKFKGQTGDNSGSFSHVPSGDLETGNSFDRIYAVYPYNENNSITDAGVISLTLPAVQQYAETSFGRGANTMIAVTESKEDTFLAFKNACGYLKLKLYGNATIKSIELKGNFAEKIAGGATVTAIYGENPILKMGSAATQTITLDCGDGVVLGTTAETATEFWVVIPETTFKYGITITATSIDNKTFKKSTSNSVKIERNTLLPMSALEFVGESSEILPIEDSTIVYTTDDENIVDLYTTEGFGAAYVSNIYDHEKKIGTITFDGAISTIPAEAFLVCTNLTSIQLPGSVSTIAERAFYGCNYMEKLIIPASVTSIGVDAFRGCSGEVVIDCEIGDNAFEGALFSKATINNAIVGKEAFMDCINLKEVSLPNSITTIPYCTFQNTALENIMVPEGVVSIGDGAFYGCNKLKTAILPESVNTIGVSTFGECRSLQEIKMPSTLASIGSGAFRYCISLLEINIPEGVSSIEDKLFHNCTNLTSLSLPSTLTSLSGAFYGCEKLTRLNLVDINVWLKLEPKDASGYLGGEHPFSDSTGGDIYVNGELLTDLVIPNNITTIHGSAFRNVKSLKSVTFGSRVTTIGKMAFDNCSNIDKLTFPKSLSTVGFAAFRNTGISEITITKNIANNSSGASIFANCDNLTNVTIEDDVTILPNNLFGENTYAGGGCDRLTSIVIPASITSIGQGVFEGCTSLKSVALSKGITSIGTSVFKGCFALEEVILPSNMTTIPIEFFRGCSSLNNVVIPEGVTEIGNYAFEKSGLTSIELPQNLKYIGSSTFYGCKNLEYINIPSGVKTLEREIFCESGLKQVQLPETIETIKYGAFQDCDNLTSIVLPSSISEIDSWVLAFCARMESVYFLGDVPSSINSNFVDGTIGHTTIYVPEEYIDNYKSELPQLSDYIQGYTPTL